jgi:hypothetical protein
MAFGKTALILALGLAPMVAGSSASMAGAYVTAYSDYGNGSVSGPVRASKYGYQVKIPGGSWLDCERSGLFTRASPCSETLRRATIDFWDTQSEDGGRG